MLRSHLLAIAVLPLALASCAEAENALNDAAASAACQAAQEAAKPVVDGAKQAADDLGADPAAAKRELEQLKDVVDAAAAPLSGETEQALREISTALGDLLDQAKRTASAEIDQTAVDQAQRELDSAVDELGQVC